MKRRLHSRLRLLKLNYLTYKKQVLSYLFKLMNLSFFSDLTCLQPRHLIERVHFGKVRYCCSFVIVNTCICELFGTIEPILVFPCDVHEPVGHDLNDLSPLRRSVRWHLPFVEVLLRMELNSEDRIFLRFHDGNELFVVGRGGSPDQVPEFPEQLILVECVDFDSIIIIIVDQPMTLCHFLDLIFIKSFKQIALLSSELNWLNYIEISINFWKDWCIIVCC